MRRQLLAGVALLVAAGFVVCSEQAKAVEWNFPWAPGWQAGGPSGDSSGSGGGSGSEDTGGSSGGNEQNSDSSSGDGTGDGGAGDGGAGDGGIGGGSEQGSNGGEGSAFIILGEDDHSFSEGSSNLSIETDDGPNDTGGNNPGERIPVPEPSGMAILASALLFYGGLRRRKARGVQNNPYTE